MKTKISYLNILNLTIFLYFLSYVGLHAGTGDGSVLSVTKIQDNGPDSQRFNIVIMGDGYQTSEIPLFETQAQNVVNTFNAQLAFGPCGSAVNFYRVNIESDDSGVDKPAACYGTATNRDTYLDVHYCSGSTQRCIWSSNTALVQTTANDATTNWHFIVVLANDPENGGCAGGNITFNSTGVGFERIVMHELGHAIGNLADEYEEFTTTYTGAEPTSPNLTIQTNKGSVKWFDLILATTPVPTWNKSNCAVFSNPPVTWNGIVGTYEGGGRHYTCGIYRSEPNGLMRTLGVDFCEVCTRRIQQVLLAFYSDGNLSITPWGYFLSPPSHPYWQTPDIWCDNNGNNIQEAGEPSIGKSDNHLFARITNTGNAATGIFDVNFSYVPFTGVIDMSNKQNITTISRPSLSVGGTDIVEVLWDLTSIPPAFVGVDHFCVIVEIISDECITYDNIAQNNFGSVLTIGPSPAPVAMYIKNIYSIDAIGRLDIEPESDSWQISANVPDIKEIPLRPNEEKLLVLEFIYQEKCDDSERDVVREINRNICVKEEFDVTYKLNGDVLGGISSEIIVYPQRRKFGISLHSGVAIPRGDFAINYDPGVNYLFDASYWFNQNWALVGFTGYNDFISTITGFDNNRVWNLSLNLRNYREISTMPGNVWSYYLGGGLGVYIPDFGDTEFGFNIGFGINRVISSAITAEIGMDYHKTFDTIEFIHSHIGVVYKF